ncbi:MAG: hypothetical protein EXS10_06340 [Phycisphaerales bacterium]|nr:hypothetical protein [Phycisphaerales bacterium]
MTRAMHVLVTSAMLFALAWSASVNAQTFVPEVAPLAPELVDAVNATHLSKEERKDFRVAHGIYDDSDLDAPTRIAIAALHAWRLDDPVFLDDTIAVELRAESLARQARFPELLALLKDAPSALAAAMRAEAYFALDRDEEAREEIRTSAEKLPAATRAGDLVGRARLIALGIRLGADGNDGERAILALLARARQEFDRFDATPRLMEGERLAARGALEPAVNALLEALARNPRESAAWRLLGDLAIERFDFEGAERAAHALRRIAPRHPLAATLDARAALLREDVRAAMSALNPLTETAHPIPEALALRAALDAARYDLDGARAWLAKFDALLPGSALALSILGRQLSLDRQYADARIVLEAAVAREPFWHVSAVELGLMLLQAGEDDSGIAALDRAIALDPYNERALFSAKLAHEIATWERIETAHFIIRFPKGEASLVAVLMSTSLEEMHARVAARFGYTPVRKTFIDVMPDHRSFGVRITGMPRIHTIAASTGPVIAIEIPKEGVLPKHLGLFDWLTVLTHEYTHTVTLEQTLNRLPHWLTEAAAVRMEEMPRAYETCQKLAIAVQQGALFDLDSINWAFVRPKRAGDREMAYAQGAWMIEFMDVTFGRDALLRLLAQCAKGTKEEDAMRAALGVGREDFLTQFRVWARAEVAAWGMTPTPSIAQLTRSLTEGDDDAELHASQAEAKRLNAVVARWHRAIGEASNAHLRFDAVAWPARTGPAVDLDDATLSAFLERFPAHPDLLEAVIRRRIGRGLDATDAQTSALLSRYAIARPVDPFPHREFAKALRGSARASDALPHLLEVDRHTEKDPAIAAECARLQGLALDRAGAAASAQRAVRMNPFDPALRELAAKCWIEAGDLQRARVHLAALLELEPGRAIHQKRLDRLDELLRGAELIE